MCVHLSKNTKNQTYSNWSNSKDILRCTCVVSLIISIDAFDCIISCVYVMCNQYLLTSVKPSRWCWCWVAINKTTKFLRFTFIYFFYRILHAWNQWFIYSTRRKRARLQRFQSHETAKYKKQHNNVYIGLNINKTECDFSFRIIYHFPSLQFNRSCWLNYFR